MSRLVLVLCIPLWIQGLAMFFDEFYYHHRRGLGKWERFGHPMDTLSVLICYIFLFLFPFNLNNLAIFIGLSILSSLLVTKDEFVHVRECNAGESWLHSILFILHPITFGCAGVLWYLMRTSSLDPIEIQKNTYFNYIMNIFISQILLILGFILYQIIYWGFLWKPASK